MPKFIRGKPIPKTAERFDAVAGKLSVDVAELLSVTRTDAGESPFTALALSFVEPFVYETVLPPLESRDYVPVDKDPEGAVSTRYRMFTRTGIANFIGDVSTEDYPAVSFFVQEFAHNYYPIGASYRYTLQDLAAAALSAQNGGPPVNVDLEDALAAREAIERKLDVVAAKGSTSTGDSGALGLVGLLNVPNANTYTIADGATGSATWSSKTPDEVIADITGIIASQVNATFKRFRPQKILIPILQDETIAGRSMGDGRSDTIKSYAIRTRKDSNNPIEIDSWQHCTGAGAGSPATDRMVAYTPNKRYVRHKISKEFFQYPPVIDGPRVKVECDARTAGVVCPYPISISYGDGI